MLLVENLIGNMYWNFHEDDFIIVTSSAVVLRTQSVSAIFVPAVFFHKSLFKHIESNKNKKDGYRQQNVRQRQN